MGMEITNIVLTIMHVELHMKQNLTVDFIRDIWMIQEHMGMIG